MILLKRALPLCALTLLLAAPALAAGDDGGFGDHFTYETPAALSDEADADFSGEAVSTIEPAAGEAVWIPPAEDEEKKEGNVTPEIEILLGPDHALVPGMDVSPEAVLETLN